MINFPRLVKEAFTRAPPEPSWAWAAREVDYSRAGNYDTPYRGKFDPELMPHWKEILENQQARHVREQAIVKCSRAGFSENLVLTDTRYTLARHPEPTMYVTGTMDIAKGFFERRLCRGMNLSKETAREYKRARIVNTEIQFPSMDFLATWSTSDRAKKSDGWARVYVDEADLCSEIGADMIRRRCSAYPFHHILFGGSIDPTRRGDPGESPIWKLYQESTRAVWEMPDGDDWFVWEFGGLQWDHSAKNGDEWDIDAAAESAYYLTPNGNRITEKERMTLSRSGRWRHRNPAGIRKGYQVTAPMCPFADCSFAELTRRFLSAKSRGVDTASGKVIQPLRAYFAEYWAEPHWSKTEQTSAEALIERVEEYQYGKTPSEALERYKESPALMLATLDVQKDHFWLLIRQWFADNGGDSGLVLYQRCEDWRQVFDVCNRYKPEKIYVDCAYDVRKQEVYEVAAKTAGVIPVLGSDKLTSTYKREMIDPFEGRATQNKGGKIIRYTINPDLFRTLVTSSINGETVQHWFVPRGTPAEYQNQVTVMRKVAGKWIKTKHDDHAADCEHLQIFAAHRHRIFQHVHIEPDVSETASAENNT